MVNAFLQVLVCETQMDQTHRIWPIENPNFMVMYVDLITYLYYLLKAQTPS